MKTIRLFDLVFESTELHGAAQQVLDAAHAGRKGIVVTPNVDHLVMLQNDKEMRCIYKKALFRYADGMPIVWFSRLVSNKPLPERVTGADLLPAICEKAAGTELNLYFLGGNPGIADKAAENMRRLYPGVNIVDTYCPPFGFEHDQVESKRIVEHINSRNVHILFIGVGTPKQEKWTFEHLDRLQVGPVMCIGAALDFAAGTSKRAPRWIQSYGMEWLWRLASDPQRLWKRYLLRDSRFIPLAWHDLRKTRQGAGTDKL